MEGNEFEQQLARMSKEELNNLLITLGKPFDSFATALAKKEIPELAPPFMAYYEEDDDIIGYLTKYFANYRHYLDGIDESTWMFVNLSMSEMVAQRRGSAVSFDLKREADNLMQSIIESLVNYFKGFPSEAYESIEKVFVANKCHLLELIPQIEYRGRLYRTRQGVVKSECKELFHTPFEQRTKCGSYRYSILGYPSLYLACSLETALMETRIDDDKYSAACFRPQVTLRCIDLALPNRELSFWERYCLVLFYPLIVACGLKVKNEDAPFKPEYVIPQLLFQVARLHSDLHGISYVSTRGEHVDFCNMNQRNFVIYVPFAEQERGYSQALADMFHATLPISPANGETIIDVESRMQALELVPIEI